MGIKKSEVMRDALEYLSVERKLDGTTTFLCIAVMTALNDKYPMYCPDSTIKAICADISKAINGNMSALCYLQSTRALYDEVTKEEVYEFRVNLANKLIKQYEEEECQTIYTKLSKAYNKLKEILRNKLS